MVFVSSRASWSVSGLEKNFQTQEYFRIEFIRARDAVSTVGWLKGEPTTFMGW